jgi:hypothetical protein
MTTVKERPIPFNGKMVKAILSGTKTQARRVVKPQPYKMIDGWPYRSVFDRIAQAIIGNKVHRCPYGKPGDRLWVKETHYLTDDGHKEFAVYAADADDVKLHLARIDALGPNFPADIAAKHRKLRPSIHMPRWASRITLEITGVRVERLQEITEDDAKAEGAQCGVGCPDHRIAFGRLWENINGAGSWADNPFVWVLEFKRIEATHG